ncbi:MAG: DUF1385 domain-containing protein [Clostridia bacterium]|nr:DUF1385 domain-containing protein [Clostridia bacterium]
MSKENYVAVGGQALMEGIMMRGPKGTAMSCRLPDGTIDTEMKDFKSIRKKYKFLNVPIIRGVIAFVESMIMGYKLLMESAEKTTMDLGDEPAESKLDKWIEEHFGPKMMAVIGTIASVLGIGLAFVLFIWMPTFVFDLISKHSDISMKVRPLFEGAIRIVIFVLYMYLTSRMKDIHRVYMYHGAEHKTIACFENGHELTPANVMKEIRFHPRCGTSFIFVTILLSIFISSIAAVILPESFVNTRWLWIIVKLLLLPLIMGVGFEFIQLAGKYPNKLTKALSAPGLAMQRITTAEPDEAICEVAIAAMNAALTVEVPAKEEVEIYDDMFSEKTDDAQ